MNTESKIESLEDAYKAHKEKYSTFTTNNQSEQMLSFSFEEGAKWQKEKDQFIVNGLSDALSIYADITRDLIKKVSIDFLTDELTDKIKKANIILTDLNNQF